MGTHLANRKSDFVDRGDWPGAIACFIFLIIFPIAIITGWNAPRAEYFLVPFALVFALAFVARNIRAQVLCRAVIPEAIRPKQAGNGGSGIGHFLLHACSLLHPNGSRSYVEGTVNLRNGSHAKTGRIVSAVGLSGLCNKLSPRLGRRQVKAASDDVSVDL
jgi:hypothetical protein